MFKRIAPVLAARALRGGGRLPLERAGGVRRVDGRSARVRRVARRRRRPRRSSPSAPGPRSRPSTTIRTTRRRACPTKRINALNPSVEAIIGICKTTASHPSTKPDLVIISYDANAIKEKLIALGVKVVEQEPADSLASAPRTRSDSSAR